ncbi:BON domain-containing protein [uncultured Roseobacter sp.]|uniref:BON domain-containing protein n=1 Tax=uncultured Roseobacter sp. TaxID=114847 RepID=UPI002633CF1E|nr:BON domain-containing protein [uncultured Roseobacter sp.]
MNIEPVASDEVIAEGIDCILGANDWYDATTVTVYEDVAFLDGLAETETQRMWALDLSGKINGVVAVVHRIEVSTKVNGSFDPALARMTPTFPGCNGRAAAVSFGRDDPHAGLVRTDTS